MNSLMNTKKLIPKLLITGMAIGILGCANPMEPISKVNCTTCTEGANATENQPPASPSPVDPWHKIEGEMTGYANTGNGQQKLLGINKDNKTIVLTIPFSENLFPEMQVEVPQLPGAMLISRLNSDNKTVVEFHVPIKYLLKSVDFGNPQRLPNGDPLPSIPGGELPGIELNFPVKDVKIHLYLGAEVLGIFVEVPFDPYVKITLPIKTQKNDGSQERTLGYLSSIPVKKPYRGGFFLSLLMPADLARILDDLLNNP